MKTPLFVLLLATTVACADTSKPSVNPTAPPKGPRRAPEVPSQMDMARRVPGFGGYYLDPAAGPTVYLTDYSQRRRAELALSGLLARSHVTASGLRVVRGVFAYSQLDQWYEQARADLFAIHGVVLGDVDEGRNRIRIGVASEVAGARVRATLATLGIPAAAVLVEQQAPFFTLSTLRDYVRPLQGGLEVTFFPGPAGLPAPGLICTLGFNVTLGRVRSFVTNSHCTNSEGGAELPTRYHQSRDARGAAAIIGTEADDPHWELMLTPQCPPPFACRYSDAARVDYEPGADAPLGRLALLEEMTTSPGDTTHTIVGEFTIVGERLDPILGETAHKVGRTTGWTAGTTTGTCVDVLALGTRHMRLCQAVVAAVADGGDSGAPVFAREGGTDVTLLGILWGGSTDITNPEFVFSPLSGIKRELGAFRTF